MKDMSYMSDDEIQFYRIILCIFFMYSCITFHAHTQKLCKNIVVGKYLD